MQKSDAINSRLTNAMVIGFRVFLGAVFLCAFVAEFNPARVSELINRNHSLFTNAVSYTSIGDNFIRALYNNWITQTPLTLTYIGALVTAIATLIIMAAFCVSFGNLKMRRLCVMLSICAAVVGFIGISILRFAAYESFANSANPERLSLTIPRGITIYYIIFTLTVLLSAILYLRLPKPDAEMEYEMASKYKLFLMIFPFLVLVALFAYLPLWGWRYSFFDYTPGIPLSMDNFVGLKWVRFLFNNPAIRSNIGRVMVNTFAMSGLGLAFSWLPILFAIFLMEIRSGKLKRVIQTLTTIPNFISWVLVYSVAFAIFSTEGFMNWLLITLGIIEEGTNYLLDGSNIWIKMWAWGTWKGLGWSAIIYIASISSIDPQLYEAATVDGAGRFKRMWHVTVPGLMPTFFVLTLLAISGILSNGMDQYYVFSNAANQSTIEVLDLYVFNIGFGDGNNYAIATIIGVLKSVISITLLLSVNRLSKAVRGESIV